jgi:hypothetical protein
LPPVGLQESRERPYAIQTAASRKGGQEQEGGSGLAFCPAILTLRLQPRHPFFHPLLPDVGINLGGGQIDARQPRTATLAAPNGADWAINVVFKNPFIPRKCLFIKRLFIKRLCNHDKINKYNLQVI